MKNNLKVFVKNWDTAFPLKRHKETDSFLIKDKPAKPKKDLIINIVSNTKILYYIYIPLPTLIKFT